MNLLTAQGAVTALKTKTTLDAAYVSYDAGHDDKHRKAGVAYSYNYEGATGDETAGYYQTDMLVPDPAGTIAKETKAWGKTTVTMHSRAISDMSKEDEKRLLLAAFNALGGYYVHPNASRFHYATFIPAGFKGYLFQGGGKVYPKMATETNVMVIVISAGGSNVQIVTHFPEYMDTVNAMTKLT